MTIDELHKVVVYNDVQYKVSLLLMNASTPDTSYYNIYIDRCEKSHVTISLMESRNIDFVKSQILIAVRNHVNQQNLLKTEAELQEKRLKEFEDWDGILN